MISAEAPVIYLDVDGVLWDLRPGAPRIAGPAEWAKGANGCRAFIDWALAHCEVRWCTTWALSGRMDAQHLERLAVYTGIPTSVWSRVRPSRGWRSDKTEAIAWEEHRAGRPFAWLEDGLLPRELEALADHGFLDAYVHVDVFRDPDALAGAHQELIRRWGPSANLASGPDR